MGLPYFSAVWVWNYYADMLEKLKIDKPFATYEEFIEHCVKAKKDGVSRYPVLWVAGVGLEQLPGTWYQMTWNKGGTFFDKQGNHQLGRRLDRARDAEMVGQHLREGPRHRRSRIAEGPVHDLGQGVRRRQEPLSRAQPSLRPERRQRSGAVADRRQGQGPGLAGRRQDDRRHPRLFPVDGQRATRNGRWKLLQYLGGKTKDGNYTQAISLAKDAMLGSGYTSVMNSDAVKQGWAPWGDVPEILKIWDKAAYIGEVCSSVYQPWHFPWTDQLNIEVQKMPDRPDHGRPVLRQPDQGHRRRQAQGLTP